MKSFSAELSFSPIFMSLGLFAIHLPSPLFPLCNFGYITCSCHIIKLAHTIEQRERKKFSASNQMKYGRASVQDFFNSIYSAFIRVDRVEVGARRNAGNFSDTADIFSPALFHFYLCTRRKSFSFSTQKHSTE